MKKTITITKCDICGSDKSVIPDVTLPMYRTFDETDGRSFYEKPQIVFMKLDICEDCLRKSTNVHDRRIQGYGKINIEKNSELFIKEE